MIRTQATCNERMTFTASYNRSSTNGSPTTSGGILDNKRAAWNIKSNQSYKTTA
jgi:hypothetical protein